MGKLMCVEIKKSVMSETNPDYVALIMSEVDNPIIITNSNFDIEWVNPGFIKTYGYSLEEFIHLRGSSIFKASYNSDIIHILHKAIKLRQSVNYESQNVAKDGRKYWISSTVKPIFNDKGELDKVMIIDLNVNEKKLMEHHLALTNNILEKIGSLVVVADSYGEIVYVSPSVSSAIGYTSWELMGSGWWALSRKTEWESEAEKKFVAQCAAGITPVSSDPYEKSVVCKDGSVKWILWKDTKGPDDLLIGVGHDITERKKTDEIINAKNKDITASIRYAHRIQNAIFPSENILASVIPESFIFFKPKNIVSGDFYWYSEVRERLSSKEKKNREGRSSEPSFLISAADCTGHGVPGALMSIAGIGLMNQIVKEKGVADPAKVLSLLNIKMKEFLKQTKEESKTGDGMDIGLLALSPAEPGSKAKMKALYAGAKRPLFLIRKNKLIIYSGNRSSIGGITDSRYKFENHEISIQPGDVLYMFSDGYADQFGGEKGRKFLVKRLKDLLLSIHTQSMDEQEKVITTMFEEWKGNHEQVDDVLMIGMKF